MENNEIKIYQDTKVVKVLAAEARGERLDSNVREEADKIVKALATDMSPNNKYQMAQLIRFGVNEMMPAATDFLNIIGDYKRIAVGDQAAFEMKLPGIVAVIQAKNATTPRSRNGRRQIVLDTDEVSARPFVNIYDIQAGRVNVADMINDATAAMVNKKTGYIETVLNTAAATWAAPYYGTGAGVLAATLDPMVQHWMRTGGAAIFGDIAPVQRLAELNGFTVAANTKQYADQDILEFHRTGMIGHYKGATVAQFVNPYDEAGAPILNTDHLYILPTGADAATRPLKIVDEGDVYTIETTNIDDCVYEVRLGQYFGAGIALGNTPYMSVYVDSTL